MAVPVTLPDNYGLVLGATVSAVLINVLHVLKVIECRHKFGIKPPAVVAGPEHIKKHPDAALFDCAFRAHANYLENLPPFLVSVAILGLRYPVTSAAATAVWIAGRVAYLYGYVNKGERGAKARVPGFGIAIYTQLVVMAGAAYSAYTFIF